MADDAAVEAARKVALRELEMTCPGHHMTKDEERAFEVGWEAALAVAERERDALTAERDMLRRVVDDKYPAPPNFYLRRLLTDLHEVESERDALKAARDRLRRVVDEALGSLERLEQLTAEVLLAALVPTIPPPA